MLSKRRSLGARKVTPPSPTCMTDDQKASYLANLRNNRPVRPGGARPLPGRPESRGLENDLHLSRSESGSSLAREEANKDGSKRYSMTSSNSAISTKAQAGRPLVQAPSTFTSSRGGNPVPLLVNQPGELRYRESMSREIEKQEAQSLREALEKIDHAGDEARVYEAAQKEAADLVWKHLNPQLADHEKTAAYRNPDFTKTHERVGSGKTSVRHQQTHYGSAQSVSEVSVAPSSYKEQDLKLVKRGSTDSANTAANASNNRRRSSGKRITSSGSNKGVFRNPDDQIYEEPEDMEKQPAQQDITPELPLQSRSRNPFLRGSRPLPDKPHSVPLPERTKFNQFEIHRNPPSQSRNAEYVANPPSREATPEVETPKGRAMEIRSDEIRAATSMRRKDRSPKLPTPTAVSDRPGRPIVSFDPGWRPGNGSPRASLDAERLPSRVKPPLPTVAHSAPIVPTINLPDDDVSSKRISNEASSIPVISISNASQIPEINLPDDDTSNSPDIPNINISKDLPTQPLPQVSVGSDSKPRPRPLPSHSQSSPAKLGPVGAPKPNRMPWLSRGPTTAGTTVTCNACHLPIAGRIVTASGSIQGGPKVRFHPECFTCFHCSTALECVSFYPEPENARTDRIEQDADADHGEMRFYCHLDYHDQFSPRCASCKTPIEGAIVLAAGKSWHEGHFFCAECGDPFSSTSPFVEDKGYAYCVGCHTKRNSARCRACKRQILDEVSVEALGGKWHEECFRCDECGSDFGDEGQFFVRSVEIDPTEKEKRKGLARKFEDRAVCQTCEELRLRRHEAFL